jgi:uncharacterized protein YndB with AHSA1/START domain
MEKPVVEVETTIAARADAVWKSMLEGAMFPGTKLETDWKPGHRMTLSGEWNGKTFTDYGEVESVEEPRAMSFSHWSKTPERPDNYHLVRYALEAAGAMTRVTLSQFNMGPDPEIDDKTRAEFKKTWTMMLDGLKTAVEAN